MSYVVVADPLGSPWRAVSVDGYLSRAVQRQALRELVGPSAWSLPACSPRHQTPSSSTEHERQQARTLNPHSLFVIQYPEKPPTLHRFGQLFREFPRDPDRKRYVHFLCFTADDLDPRALLLAALERAHFEMKPARRYADYERFLSDCRALLEELLEYFARPPIPATSHLIHLGFRAARL